MATSRQFLTGALTNLLAPNLMPAHTFKLKKQNGNAGNKKVAEGDTVTFDSPDSNSVLCIYPRNYFEKDFDQTGRVVEKKGDKRVDDGKDKVGVGRFHMPKGSTLTLTIKSGSTEKEHHKKLGLGRFEFTSISTEDYSQPCDGRDKRFSGGGGP